MKSYYPLPALALALVLAACGANDPVPPDATPPGRVTDLHVKSATTNVITLRWTTPGDNGNQGTARTYQVRWSPAFINEGNFGSATPIPDPPVPAAPGSVELFAVPNMDITQTIHFAVRTIDEVGLTSPVSNDAYWSPTGFPVQFYTDLPAVRDNTMYQEADSLSNGAGQYLFAGKNEAGFYRRALLAFAITDSIPSGAVIDSVRLVLHMSSPGTGADTVRVHAVTADWGEGTSDAPAGEENGVQAESNDATWGFRFYNTDTWTSAGGDYIISDSGKIVIDGPGFYTWKSEEMKDNVQAWLDTPANNSGWLIASDETGPLSIKRFDSREHATPGYRPRLKVYYTIIPVTSRASAK
ncbi:MAG TPA: DNRLRE domain-containing protein [Candidatus Krumholzibacteria bacterium]